MNIEKQQSTTLSAGERRAAFSLALVYASRMMGLFMILPVFALYARQLNYSSPILIGIAIGIYGLTQALLQIPFGYWSDRIGRKPVIIFGLILFALGGLVAAFSDGIYGVIVGRALQGSGAVAAVVMALAADLSRENQRTKMMAIIGMSIGASFIASMVLGPYLYNHIGVPGIFGVTAVLAVTAIGIIIFLVPSSSSSSLNLEVTVQKQTRLSEVVCDKRFLPFNLGILLLHMILTASFIAVPFLLRDLIHIPEDQHWKVYLGVMAASLLIAVPCIMVSDRQKKGHLFMLIGVLVLGLSEVGLAVYAKSFYIAILSLVFFFGAFNLLEASLPALISKAAPAHSKGLVMGVFSSSQFLGAFLGGTIGGWVWGHYQIQGVLILCSFLAVLWFIIAINAGPRTQNAAK